MSEASESYSTVAAAMGPSGMGPDPGVRDPLRVTLQGLLQGFEAMIADGTTLVTRQGPLVKEQIVAELADALAVYSELDAHRRAVAQALKQIATASAANRRRAQQLKDLLLGFYGRGDPRLGRFGMKAHDAPRPLTPEAKVLRAHRVRDTRALRHTMGKRQRAAIKGEGKLTLKVGPSDESKDVATSNSPLDLKTPAG